MDSRTLHQDDFFPRATPPTSLTRKLRYMTRKAVSGYLILVDRARCVVRSLNLALLCLEPRQLKITLYVVRYQGGDITLGVPGGPKLMGFDVANNATTPFTTITFTDDVLPSLGYLNDLRIDLTTSLTKSGKGVVYLADSGRLLSIFRPLNEFALILLVSSALCRRCSDYRCRSGHW